MWKYGEEKVEEFLIIFWSEIGGWMEQYREDGVCEKCVEGE